jgi:hypothetical protein
MAVSTGLLDRDYTVSGNGLSAALDQFVFVQLGATEGQVAPAMVGAKPIGISQDVNPNGRNIPVRLIGTSKLRCGTTITAGQAVSPDSIGEATPHTGPGVNAGAIALESGVDGDVIEVLLERFNGATWA